MAKNSKEIKELTLSAEDIKKAIEEMPEVKKKYPSFWKLFEMIQEMNNGLSALQEAMEADAKKKMEAKNGCKNNNKR